MPPAQTAALDPRAVNRPPVAPAAPAADAGPRAGVRAEGFAIDVQELEIGLRSLAVPVRDALAGAVAAMNVNARASRVSRRELIDTFRPLPRNAAARLGSRLSPTR